MTIKQRIFRTNSLMVLFSLVILLLIGGSMISIFKDRFLGWYSDNSKIAENYVDAYQKIENMDFSAGDWEQYAKAVQPYDFRLIVRNENGKELYYNVRHNEEEGAEPLYDKEKENGTLNGYIIENVTLLVTRQSIDGRAYDLYFASSVDEKSIFGMDRGMFESFIIAFLVVGIFSIMIILMLSQLMTKKLIKMIMKPVNMLGDAAGRIIEGDLDTAIDYMDADEFQPVCKSFDLMQLHLKEQMEKNLAYEKARTEMVSGISHDLRTPLTSIKGYIKGMLDGIAGTEEKRQEYLSVAYKKACDMEKLLAKLFYFSKLETGNMPFYFQEVPMQIYMEDYVAEKEVEMQTKGGQIRGKFDALAGVKCKIDREQMQRVFDNLVENSCKYACPKEQLEICVEAFWNPDRSDQIRLVFSDNGQGMEPEKLKHVFEQFYRGDEARNAVCDGNGLGLYVCRYIIEKHGGTVRADGNEGFVVEITLPVSEKLKGE